MKLSGYQYKRLQSIQSFDDGFYLILRYLFYFVGGIGAVIAVLGLIVGLPWLITEVAYICLSFGLLISSITLYFGYLKNNPEYGLSAATKQASPFNNFTFDALAILELLAAAKTWGAFWRSVANHHQLDLYYRLGLIPSQLEPLDNQPITEDELQDIIQRSLAAAEGQLVTQYQLLRALVDDAALAEFLKQEKLTTADVEVLLTYYNGLEQSRHLARRPARTGGVGRDWAVSYTNLVDMVAETLPADLLARRALQVPLYSRETIVDQLVTIMLKSAGQNVLLTGESGVGKTEIFYHLAAKIANYKTSSPLDGRTIRVLDIQRLLSLVTDPGELQQIMGNLFAEIARAGNIILFIDQIDTLLEPSGKLGTVDVSSLLQSYLGAANIIVVGTLTSDKYLTLVRPSALLSQSFTSIQVGEPDEKERLGMVLSHLNPTEGKYGTFFTLSVLKDVCRLAARYIKDEVSPQREITLCEEVSSLCHARGEVLVTTEDVEQAVEQKAKVPLTANQDQTTKLANLEELLHQRVIGQNVAIKEVSDALLRARAGLTTGQKPIGSFLFLGPTGVGKTETAKALSAIYFGSQKNLIRLDMTEYADEAALEKLLGSDPVRQPGSLTVAIQDRPSAVVLFDEIEKSHPNIKNVLLQLLDEGRITTNFGKVLDFTNTIVIATSNAGSDFIRSQIEAKQTVAALEKQLIDQLISQKIFLTEFLNRFDGVIVYTPLTQTEIEKVVSLRLAELSAKLKADKGLELSVSPAVVTQLAQKGYDPVFGARALERVIKSDLETAIAKQIIAQNPQPGSTVTIQSL